MSNINRSTRRAYEKGYRISESGALISPDGREVKGGLSNRGYRRTRLGKGNELYFHKLAAYQKFGEKMFEKGMQVRHLDGVQDNNSLGNIGLGTNSDNQMDIPKAKRVERSLKGGKARRKLTDDEVRQLRRDKKEGMSYKQLQKKYALSPGTLVPIIKRRTYSAVV